MANERDPAIEDARGDGSEPSSRGNHGGDATRPMPVDEPTSTFNPFEDDDDDGSGEAGTRAVAADAEATQRMTPGDAEATQRMTPGDAADPDATRRVTPQIWAARAPIPVPDAVPVRYAAPAEWQEQAEWQEDEAAGADRSGFWARPAVIALIVLILLAMLGTGLWLIFSGLGKPSVPTPASSATPSQVSTPTATASETAPPTPSSTVVAQVAVPDVVGQSEAAAGRQLTAAGLAYTVVRRAAPGVTPGTVTATDPAAGTMVGPGTSVTLTVAAAPAPATPTPTRQATPAPTKKPTPTQSASKEAGVSGQGRPAATAGPAAEGA